MAITRVLFYIIDLHCRDLGVLQSSQKGLNAEMYSSLHSFVPGTTMTNTSTITGPTFGK